MKLRKGRSRIVIIIGTIAIKLPRIRIIRGIKVIYNEFRDGYLLSLYKNPTLCPASSKSFLLGGIITNWREYKFYQVNTFPVLAKTWFSLFGLINFQQAGQALEISNEKFIEAVINTIGSDIQRDTHHFETTANTCLDKYGKVIIVDYGSIATQQIIKKHHQALRNMFD